jgi:hypothetical protein
MLNLKETKIMTTGTLNKFILDTFLGTIITRDGYDHKEINRRLSMGRLAMIKLEKLMKVRDVMVATKIKIAETIIFPIVTYGCESWMVRKKDRKKIDAFELWTWRKVVTSTVDREKNEPISFGRSEAQKITRSNNHPIKVKLFRSRNESKRVTGTGHYAWTSCRTQETIHYGCDDSVA